MEKNRLVEIKSISDLDEEDKKLLRILQEDGKASLRDLEEQIGLSTTAIRARLKKLKKGGIIKKTMAIIDCCQLGYREMVIASLRVNSKQPLDDLKRKIEGMPELKYAYVMTGEYPLVVMFKCMSHEDTMKQIQILRGLSGVEEIKTEIVLERIKEDHSIIIP